MSYKRAYSIEVYEIMALYVILYERAYSSGGRTWPRGLSESRFS